MTTPPLPSRTPVQIEADGGVLLAGDLAVPDDARGVVLFAHGSGSSHQSPRNRSVAEALQSTGLATLLFDLLSGREADDRSNVFNIALLAERLETATRWAQARADVGALSLGYFGASTGAAAALVAAARLDDEAAAVVSRGGRPDLAGDSLPAVTAPTLLIVGGEDREVLRLNEAARERMTAPTELEVVPGATHLFEEPGALERVATLATTWFTTNLTA